MLEIVRSIGPLGSIGFLISLFWLFRTFFISSGRAIVIGGVEAGSFAMVFTTLASVVLVQFGVRDLTHYRPIHFNLSFGFASFGLFATLFLLRSKYPRYKVFWKEIAVKSKEQTIVSGIILQICIQLLVFWMLPWPTDRFGAQNAAARFYSILVGDFHRSIGFGLLACWLTVVILTVMVMRLSFGNPTHIQKV